MNEVGPWRAELNLRLLTVLRKRAGQFSQQTMERMIAARTDMEWRLIAEFGNYPSDAPIEDLRPFLDDITRTWYAMQDAPGDSLPEMPYGEYGRRNPGFTRL